MVRYLEHEYLHEGSEFKTVQSKDSLEQLVISIEKIIREYPPQEKYSSHECHGLYSGPTSIAYLLMQLSKSHPHIDINGLPAKQLVKEYLRGERALSPVSPSRNGVISEMLAFHAVRAAFYHSDWFDVDKFSASLESLVNTAEEGSDEWLYGRAGCLYLLRLVRTWRPSVKAHTNTLMTGIIQTMMNHGPNWKWHGKEYLGAVHGRIGIIAQIILSNPTKASDPLLLSCLRETLTLQTPNGNWPSSLHSTHTDLIQFCHGAPGFIISLKAIKPHLSFDPSLQKQIAAAIWKAQDCVLRKGLLTKQPNLCHGATGNALALNSPDREFFMTHTTDEAIEKGLREGVYIPGDDPYGLFCGKAGQAWGWLALVFDEERGMIGFSDV